MFPDQSVFAQNLPLTLRGQKDVKEGNGIIAAYDTYDNPIDTILLTYYPMAVKDMEQQQIFQTRLGYYDVTARLILIMRLVS